MPSSSLLPSPLLLFALFPKRLFHIGLMIAGRNGDPGWTGNPPAQDAIVKIKEIDIFYNTA